MINRPTNIGHAYYRKYLRMMHRVEQIDVNIATARLAPDTLARLKETREWQRGLAKLAWHRMTQREVMGLDSER